MKNIINFIKTDRFKDAVLCLAGDAVFDAWVIAMLAKTLNDSSQLPAILISLICGSAAGYLWNMLSPKTRELYNEHGMHVD